MLPIKRAVTLLLPFWFVKLTALSAQRHAFMSR